MNLCGAGGDGHEFEGALAGEASWTDGVVVFDVLRENHRRRGVGWGLVAGVATRVGR